jgi:hypothetical protein
VHAPSECGSPETFQTVRQLLVGFRPARAPRGPDHHFIVGPRRLQHDSGFVDQVGDVADVGRIVFFIAVEPVVHEAKAFELLGEIGDHLRPLRPGQPVDRFEPGLGVGQQPVDDARRAGMVGVDQRELVDGGSALGRRPDRSLEGFSVLVRVQYEALLRTGSDVRST